MCLHDPDPKPDKRPGRGYKVVEKKDGRYFCWDYNPVAHTGKFEYFLGRWQTDPNTGRIHTCPANLYDKWYRAGYHVGLNKEAALETAEQYGGGRQELVVLECSYRKVVASEMSDPTYGGVKVAREIKPLKEVTS